MTKPTTTTRITTKPTQTITKTAKMATKALHVDTSVIMEGVFRLKTNIGSDTNTGKAYNPKQVEFIAFCDYA